VSDRGKGRKFEHEIRHILEAGGFSVVRGANSKGEFFGDKVDLIDTNRRDRRKLRPTWPSSAPKRCADH